MKRISTILILLVAIGLVAVSALPPAAHAVQISGEQSGNSGAVVGNTTTAGTAGTTAAATGSRATRAALVTGWEPTLW